MAAWLGVEWHELSGSAAALILAFTLGAAIGVERGMSTSSVGIRTCTLVALASAVFADLVVRQVSDTQWGVAFGAVATGVGFLGAGAIIKGAGGASVTGLGEAGTIWCTAMIGLLVGAGDIAIALLVTALVLAVNVLFRPVAAWIDRHRKQVKPEDDVLDG
jgi:putative Mg2+ transporter-C (MgtC) family protein